jgi:ER lumen protein retaining receptor
MKSGMNVFRLMGDMCHLLSFLVLYHKIHRTRSCKGVFTRNTAAMPTV